MNSLRPPPKNDSLFTFTPHRSLLQPLFNSYKLQSTPDDAPPASSSYPLPQGSSPRLEVISDPSRLSYAEVQDRARFSRLAAGVDGDFWFVDEGWRVVRVTLGEDHTPSFGVVVSLPEPLQADGAPASEAAAIVSLSRAQLGVSDGHGRLYIITFDPSNAAATGAISRTFTLSLASDGSLSPFRLHSLDVLPTGQALALLSVVVKVASDASTDDLPPRAGPVGMTTAPRAKVASKTAFEYVAVGVDLAADRNAAEEETALEVKWKLRGADLPSYVAFVDGSYAIGSSSKLFDPAALAPARPSASPSSDATATAGSTSTSASAPAPAFVSPAPRPPPYSWTQDKDSLTLIFPLLSNTPTSAIRVTFSRQFLSLVVGTARSALASSPGTASLVSHKPFWDSIDPSSSIWTFDREAEGRDGEWGLLSLHLEKSHPGTKWPDVFAHRAEGEPALEGEERLEGVQETVDPSELAGIVERMEQWHRESGLSTPAGAAALEGEFEGGEMPASLKGEEMDVEVDGDSGTPFVVSWIKDAATTEPKLSVPPAGMSFSLLSTPLPLAQDGAELGPGTVTIKHDVDELSFAPTGLNTFTHQATFPALAFVLASKRDLHYVHHVSDRLVLAFDSPSDLALASASRAGAKTGAGTGSLFVYWNTEVGDNGKRETSARQAVLKVGQGGEGGLVGVAGAREEDGRVRVVALCERALVVFEPL